MPHALARLSGDWGRVLATSGAQAATAATNGAHTSEAAGAAESEVIAERLLRELTAEYTSLLASLQDEGAQPPCSYTAYELRLAVKSMWSS